jgi:Disulphide bond corrector protein DsbC
MVLAAPYAQSFLKNQPQRVRVEAQVTRTDVPRGPAFTLTITATPVPGVHVYAPGNPNYNPVTVTLRPVEGLAFGVPTYPKAEPYFFAPLRESVKVYSKPFTVRVPVKVTFDDAKETAAGTATVKGTFDYQACDDKLCFPPQSAPFTATFALPAPPQGS